MSAVQFVALGGGSSIGGSCYLISGGDAAILVDCGVHPEKDPTETYVIMNERARASGLVSSLADISAFVLTHAHTDHSGLVPALYRHCRRGNSGHMPYFYMTRATKHLLPYVARNVLRFTDNPPFCESDLHEMLDQVRVVGAAPTELDWLRPELGFVRLHPNSHLLGSAMVELDLEGTTVLLTGDMRLGASPTLDASGVPPCRPQVVVVDGTYAGSNTRSIGSWEDVRSQMCEMLDRHLDASGTVLLPCFAIGRAQDVLGLVLEYGESHPNLPFYVYLDGQSRDITMEMLSSFAGLLRADYSSLVARNRWRIRPVDPDVPLEHLLETEILGHPSVVIASSGMLLTGSASRRWADLLARSRNASIGITGYLDEEMHEELFARKVLGEERLALPVTALPISGHAPIEEMLQLIAALQARSVVLVHCGGGDLLGPGSLLHQLQASGVSAQIAREGDVIPFPS